MNQIILYGFGGLGKKFYNYITSRNFDVVSILDKNKTGEKFGIIKIGNPKVYECKILPIIITILNEYVNLDEVKQYLIDLGYRNVYTIFEAIKEFNLIDFEHLFIKHLYYLNDSIVKNNIRKTRDLLSDEQSRKIFDSIVDFRKTFDYNLINHFCNNDMYLPEPVIAKVKELEKVNIVDCGACYGDLVDIFNNKNININNYYAFEPDKSNLSKLKSKIIDKNINSCIFPMGVGNFNGLIGFNYGSGTGCNIDVNSNDKIMVTKIDDVVLSDVNFVKMDIEGFENEALEGMQELIKKNKPILAISVYHKPLDFIDIPLSFSRNANNFTSECIEDLDSILSCMEYKNFYIRYHGNYGFEFVLYVF